MMNSENWKRQPGMKELGVILLLIPIVFMGVTPIWLSDMIRESLAPFIEEICCNWNIEEKEGTLKLI